MKYTPQYFIKILSKKRRWCIGDYSDGYGAHCGLGHLGQDIVNNMLIKTPSSMALTKLFNKYKLNVTHINDRSWEYEYFGKTPKERVLTALTNIKYLEKS